MHAWGRTAVVNVKSVWVNIDGDNISVGVDFDDPVLDGKPQKGYFFSDMAGQLSYEFPENIQTLVSKEIIGTGHDETSEIFTVRTAVVVMRGFQNGDRPQSVTFTQNEWANFDVQKLKAKFESGDVFQKRTAEFLEGFDDMGFRSRSFKAVFDLGRPRLFELFMFSMPKDLKENQPFELEIVVVSESDVISEGYYVEVFAIPPKVQDKPPSPVTLGGKDIFKPLLKGETTTIYVEGSEDIRKLGGENAQLMVGVRIKPAQPDREIPKVELRIDKMKAISAKVPSRKPLEK